MAITDPLVQVIKERQHKSIATGSILFLQEFMPAVLEILSHANRLSVEDIEKEMIDRLCIPTRCT